MSLSIRAILTSLLTFNKSIDELAEEMRTISWDYNDTTQTLSNDELIEVIERFIAGKISASDLE